MDVWETPAEGLPSRVTAALLGVMRSKMTPKGWHPRHGPLTWQLNDVHGVLAAGRRSQFGFGKPIGLDEASFEVKRSTAWELIPNAAFFLPFVSAAGDDLDRESYVLYCDVLLLLTVLDGQPASRISRATRLRLTRHPPATSSACTRGTP